MDSIFCYNYQVIFIFDRLFLLEFLTIYKGVIMITVKFSKTYDEVLTQSYLFHSGLVRDLALFSAYSPLFSVAYDADFLNLIENAGELPTNEEDLNNQVILSLDLDNKMEDARLLYRKLISYVNLKWGNDDAALRAFGNNLYDKARQSPPKMVNLLELAHRSAESSTYKTDLIAVGFIQTDINSLLTLSVELNEVFNNQQEFINLSSSRAQERVTAFNKVWDVMVQINFASKQVFKDSPALIEYYLLYPESGTVGKLTAPQNFMFDPVNYDFSWSAVTNATSYILQESTDGTNWTQYWSGPETTCGYEESPTTIMYYRVLAHNSGGNSAPSTTLQYDFAPPLVAPSNLNYNYNTYYFTWNAVPNAEYYEFQYRAQTNPTWNSLNAGSATSFYHADPPGEYLARVRAINGSNQGPWSMEEEYSVGAP